MTMNSSKVVRDYTFVIAFVAFAFYLDVFYTNYVFPLALLIALGFVRYRKEVYILWSVIEPRVTGGLNFTKRILDIAREEGPGGAVLNDIVRFDVPLMAPIFVVIKPAYIRKIMSLDVENFKTAGDQGPMTMLTNGGHNILLSPGPPDPLWKAQREVTIPLNKDRFGEESLVASLFRSSLKICTSLSDDMKEKHDGKAFDFFKYIFHFMVTANNVTVFGEEFGAKAFPGLTDDMYKAVLAIGVDLISPPSLVTAKALAEKVRVTSDSYAKIKQMVNQSTTPLLTHLKGAVKEGKVKQEELECLMAVVAYALAPLHTVFWICYNLARHPDVQSKLALEIRSTLERGPITYSKLAEMPYLTQVINETLRLFPGVALLQPRTPQADCTLGPHTIPKGSTLFIFPYLSHRNARYWKNPDTFNPDRPDLTTTNSDLKYFPFGFGPRICQGQFYAENLLKAATIAIVSKHKLTILDGEPEIHGEEIGFCRPNENIKFIVEGRPEIVVQKTQHQVPLSVSMEKPVESSRQALKTSKLAPTSLKGSVKGALHNQSQVLSDWISKNSLAKAHFSESLLVLYGSQSGKAKDLAERLGKLGQLMEFFVSVQCISSYNFERFNTIKMVVVVTSTYGHGEPPENAVPLYNWLNESHPANYLQNTKYTVLKVGSSVYSEPFAFGHFVDNAFKKLGATRLAADGRIDEIKYTDDEDFNQFAFDLFSAANAPKDKLLRSKSLEFFNTSVVKSKYKVTMVDSKTVPPNTAPNGAFSVEVLQNDKITKDSQNEIYKMEVKNSANLRFEVGDELVVWPLNSESEVKSLISRLGFPAHAMFRLELDSSDSGSLPNWAIEPTNLSHLLVHHLDLNSVTPSLLKFFALHAQDSKEAQSLTDSAGASNAKFSMQNYTVLDVLELYPSVAFKVEDMPVFLGLLKDLRPRYYSISSSPNHSKGIIRITYKIVRYVNQLNKRREGVCSSFLASRKVKEHIYVKVQTSTFRIPADPATPIIMIGAGTGVSPFIGFTEERRYQKEVGPIGKTTFLYGCSNKASMIEPEFWEQGIMDGVLDSVITAFSKESTEKVYVQDQISANFDKLWELIEAGACIYSCGDVKVGTAVKEAITSAIAKKNKWSSIQATEYVKKLMATKRYHRSEWGLQEDPQKTIKTARFRLWAKSVLAMVRWMNIVKAKPTQQ